MRVVQRWWLVLVAVVLVTAVGTTLLVRSHRSAAAVPGASTAAAALVGVEWQLTSFIDHGKRGVPDIASPAGQLSFPDRTTINFRADCNYSGGSVRLAAGRLVLGNDIASTAIGCGPGQAIPAMTQVMAARSLRWSIRAAELTVRQDDQNVLSFRRLLPGQFPSDYRGSTAIGLQQLVLSHTPVRLFYGPSVALGRLWLGVEIGQPNHQYDRIGSPASTAPVLPGTCDAAMVGQEFYFYGAARSDATSATLKDAANGRQVRLTLYRLGSSGLQAYAGWGPVNRSWTLTVTNAAGHVLGSPCTESKVS